MKQKFFITCKVSHRCPEPVENTLELVISSADDVIVLEVRDAVALSAAHQ